jgi:hypothetical protein
MGIGVRFRNSGSNTSRDEGHRFFTRTAHPKLGYKRKITIVESN